MTGVISSSSNPDDNGTRYPVDTDCYVPPGEDRNLYDARLRQDSPNLFQATGGDLHFLTSCFHQNGSGIHISSQHFSSEALEKSDWETTMTSATNWRERAFIIQPAFSWGNLRITEGAFRKLVAKNRVFVPFLAVVHGFGAKINDRQRSQDVVYHHLHRAGNYEICYNIRYYELNGRGRGSPWSLRQIGVYQRRLSHQKYVWIVICFSDYLLSRLEASLGSDTAENGACRATQAMLTHLVIVSMATRTCDAYIDYLRQKLINFEQKAYSSLVDENICNTYEIMFSDVQKANSLCDMIAVAKAVLTGQKNVLKDCQYLHMIVSGNDSACCDCNLARAIRLKIADIEKQVIAADLMERSASRIPQMLSTILTTRAEHKLRASLNQIQSEINSNSSQSLRIRDDVRGLLAITTSGHNDSKTLKTLAQIATLFLPPSLIAALFSTPMAGSLRGEGLSIGLYLTITLPLVALTMAVIMKLERNSSRP